MNSLKQMWIEMLRKSWSPYEWYLFDDNVTKTMEEKTMWVFRQNEQSLWEVGYYTPDKEWVLDQAYVRRSDAAQRVHWLNGGT